MIAFNQAFKGFTGRSKLIETVCPKDVTEAVIQDNAARVEKMDKTHEEVVQMQKFGCFDLFTGGLDSYFVGSVNTETYESKYK